MQKLLTFIFVIGCIAGGLAQYNRYNEYLNLLRQRDNPSDTTSKLLALLNEANADDDITDQSQSNNNNNQGNGVVDTFFKPPLELLEVLETFMRLKGEIAEKVSDVLYANRNLLRDVMSFIISKAGNIHRFLLNFIGIIRRVLQFGVDLVSHWNVDSPSYPSITYRPASSNTERAPSYPAIYSLDYQNEIGQK